jgi:hypothetical protein
MSTSHFILLIETDLRPADGLAAQLVRIGIEPIRAYDLDEAAEIIKSKQYVMSGIMLPSELPGKEVRKAMKSMRKHEGSLPAMAYGKLPAAGQGKLLRQAGVLLALWDGYDSGVLRFQINRMISGERQHSVRGARRAPIHEPVRVQVGGREKDGILYSLSASGCFIESPRASMESARLRLIFILEQREYEIDGVVAFSNVPGNLQRPNLPLGMGVHFEDIPKPLVKPLAAFIQARLESLEV